MRILFVCANIPTRQHIRSYGLLSALAGHGHQITLICGATLGSEGGAAELRARGIDLIAVPQSAAERRLSMLRALPGPLPLRAAAARRPQLAAAVARAARGGGYDVAHLDGIAASGLGYALFDLPAVLDIGGGASLSLARQARGGWRAGARAALDLGRTRRHEAGYPASYERLIAATEDAAWSLRTLAPAGGGPPAIHVVATPVETARETGILSLREQSTLLLCASGPGRESVIATVVAKVMPRIWAERAEVRLLVSGPVPARLARIGAADPRILSVSAADTRAIGRATIALAPGAGPDADQALLTLGAGTPLVASRLVGRALRAEDGEALRLADGPAATARAVLDLLDDPRYRGQIGRAGRAYAERERSPAAAAAELARVYAAAGGAAIAGWSLHVGLGSLINHELGA